MSRLAVRFGAINLAQGFPDFPAPAEVKRAAIEAIERDVNQYSITWGARSLRSAIAERYRRRYGLDLDPERNICVCCGSTEAMIATLLATVNPGDEVVIFEPFYENYGPDSILSGAVARLVQLRPPDWRFDPGELEAAFNSRTRAIIVNSPHNPLGKVFDRAELETIARLCRQWNVVAITDEIYEYITYDGAPHIPLATLDGMAERTVTISGLSKTFSVTGWRIGYAIAAAAICNGIRKVHDFLTVGAAAPLQEAGAVALNLPEAYYEELAAAYERRRDRLLGALGEAGFRCWKPQGAYYIMADISDFGFSDDLAFSKHLVEEVGVAVVPGSSFFSNPGDGARWVRFCFCKKDETLDEASRRLQKLRIVTRPTDANGPQLTVPPAPANGSEPPPATGQRNALLIKE
ncbi:MAG: pyridoxal phosphate-dependent aminotransferase [Acidobacteriota bacterium]